MNEMVNVMFTCIIIHNMVIEHRETNQSSEIEDDSGIVYDEEDLPAVMAADIVNAELHKRLEVDLGAHLWQLKGLRSRDEEDDFEDFEYDSSY